MTWRLIQEIYYLIISPLISMVFRRNSPPPPYNWFVCTCLTTTSPFLSSTANSYMFIGLSLRLFIWERISELVNMFPLICHPEQRDLRVSHPGSGCETDRFIPGNSLISASGSDLFRTKSSRDLDLFRESFSRHLI